ncbi:MAG: glutamate racemase [Defluviitaleaceae bacterium]|nr:glutamate racemase [Defluviitaleaceae bacterium]
MGAARKDKKVSDDRPIGIMDSGVGGLTVARELFRTLPAERFIYFGDTARVPYGGKSAETLLGYGREIISFLLEKGVKAVVVACGTISSNAINTLRSEFDIPLIDVVEPGVAACAAQGPERLGFIATEATVKSGVFTKMLRDASPRTQVFEKACPLFVPMVEEDRSEGSVAKIVAGIYLESLMANRVSALLLGCTHYPLLNGAIVNTMGEVPLINLAEHTAKAAKRILGENGMLRVSDKNGEGTVYVSGDASKFNKYLARILGEGYEALEATPVQ